MVSIEYIRGEAIPLPFFLHLEEDGFDCFGREDGVTIEMGGWSGYLAGDAATPNIAIDDEAIVFTARRAMIWIEAS